MAVVFLGIGGNLGSRILNIEKTIKLVSEKISIPEKISSLYISEPWGFEHSKYFTNAVIQLNSELSPEQLLRIIKDIETEMKRIKTSDSYEGRTMDIDILFYEEKIVNNDNLQIPHPLLQNRLFVLLPLNEIAPGFIHPALNKSISELLKACKDQSKIRRLCYGA
ncbi:MAG: 2-amino-4-hydroxy-6-hydroxymethyldihydropteridine diphosphokinase [Bacteroidales bacterium]|jgi:2-amino-4-hydroxy-6-hydroxymethyldihydropteridine diphosphokinase|nr:2-amino-4-hydroxy-6-hydroxymethyldihydropteridine diphosphokinase [Bacteroidales bacterium]